MRDSSSAKVFKDLQQHSSDGMRARRLLTRARNKATDASERRFRVHAHNGARGEGRGWEEWTRGTAAVGKWT